MNRMPDRRCGCRIPREGDGFLPVLALLPAQVLGQVYEPEYGFPRGTIFPDLDKPLGVGGMAR